MKPEQNHPSRLKSAVEPIKGSVFRVRDPKVPNSFVLVDISKDYCSCSLESDPNDIHISRAKEYARLKREMEEKEWRKRF
jgi:hypothetical protein